MYPIFICEDDPKQLNIIKALIEECIKEEKLEFIVAAQSTEAVDVIFYLEDNPVKEMIFFLDVEFKRQKYSGLQLAEKIQKNNMLYYIIFITAKAEAAAYTYSHDLECVDFIVKDRRGQMKKRIKKSLIKVWTKIRELKERSDIFEYNKYIIDPSEIFWIESSSVPHWIVIHKYQASLELRGTLTEIKKLLPPYFYQCHKGVIVNLKKIDYVDEKQQLVFLIDKRTCYGSAKLLNELKKADIQYFCV